MVLPFNIEHQTQSNWCWAATSKSISKFYSNLSSWTQCKVASSELSLICCTSPVSGPCNIPWYLDRALVRTNNFVSYGSPISWERVLEELQRGLVLGARVGWNGGGGHFMVIHGATTNGVVKYLHIDDPIYGKSVIPYNQFLSNYQGSGRWTHTYYTKTYSYFMWLKDIIYSKRLLKPILENKSHLWSVAGIDNTQYSTMNNKEDPPELPHYAYVLGIDSIKNNLGLPKSPDSLRLIGMDGQVPKVLFEVTLDEESPELIQVNTDKKYFTELEKSLNLFRSNIGNDKLSGELRLLKIPGVNIDAFWVHDDLTGGNDQLCPIKKFDEDTRFEWNKIYSETEFFNILKELAEQINLSDDLLGA